MKIIVTGPDEEARENFEADQPIFVIMVNGDLCQFESQSTVGQAVQDLVDEATQEEEVTDGSEGSP